jgi:hypothetical protein
LYLGRVRRRQAIAYWAIDAIFVLSSLAYEWVATAPVRGVPTLRMKIEGLHNFVDGTSWLLARSFVPDARSETTRGVVLLAVAIVVVIAVRRRDKETRLKPWLALLVVGAVTIVAACGAVIGSGLPPLSAGMYNRGNIFAALGYGLVVYAVLRIAAELIFRGRHTAGASASVLVAIALVSWYGQMTRHDARLWDHATARQADILASLHRYVPRPGSGTTIYLYRSLHEVAPGIPVFEEDWDFNGAVKLLYNDPSLRAFPVPAGGLQCAESGVPRPLGVFLNTPDRAHYGRIIAFDAPTGATLELTSRSDCERANSRYSF